VPRWLPFRGISGERRRVTSNLPGTTASDIMGCFTPEALPAFTFLEPSWSSNA
jgi:hypothetical protein